MSYYASIEGFKNTFTGVQRTSLFEVFLILPTKISSEIQKSSTKDVTSIFRFLCKEAPIPESTIGVIEVPYMGRKIKYFGDRQYNEWQTTILVDENWLGYSTVYNWHWLMNSPNGNVAFSTSMEDYKGRMQITAYDIQGQPSVSMTLNGVWPSSVGELSMSWENTDSIAETQITWAFDYVTAGAVNVGGTGANTTGNGDAKSTAGKAPLKQTAE